MADRYLSFYGLEEPTYRLDVILSKAKQKYGKMSTHNALINILNDFREGKLGKMTIDDDPEVEAERRHKILEEVRRLEREENK